MKSRLKTIMTEKGITVRDLVRETGVSSATIHKARDERIIFCSLQSLDKIAKALGVTVVDLIDMFGSEA
jgi:DNA-binding Xre family transcriptional regulator